jgi:hypothetical protein
VAEPSLVSDVDPERAMDSSVRSDGSRPQPKHTNTAASESKTCSVRFVGIAISSLCDARLAASLEFARDIARTAA